MFYFHPYLGKSLILTNIFQMGWFNHQLDYPLDCVAQAGLPEDGSPQRTVRFLLLFRGENGSPCGSDLPSLKLTYSKRPWNKKAGTQNETATPPKLNSSPPEKWWLEDHSPFGDGYIFRGYVELPGGTTIHFQVQTKLVSGRVLPKEIRECQVGTLFRNKGLIAGTIKGNQWLIAIITR